MQRAYSVSGKTVFCLALTLILCSVPLSAASFSASLTVNVGFPGVLPPNVVIAPGAAAVLPNCAVNVISQPAGGICNNATSNFAANVLRFTAGPISGESNPPTGAVTANSTGTSQTIVVTNNNAAAVPFDLSIGFSATLNAAAGALEFASASYGFRVLQNAGSIFNANKNLACPACGVAPPVNDNPRPAIAMLRLPPGATSFVIDPTVEGIAISNLEIPEPSTFLLMGAALSTLLFKRRKHPVTE